MWKEENYYYYVIVFNINTKLATFIKDIAKIIQKHMELIMSGITTKHIVFTLSHRPWS